MDVKVPTAMLVWMLGTGILGGIASFILARRAEREEWSTVKVGALGAAIILASVLNVVMALTLTGTSGAGQAVSPAVGIRRVS